jgi:hypothetical protein
MLYVEESKDGYSVSTIKCKCGSAVTSRDGVCPALCPDCGEILNDAGQLISSVTKRIAYHRDKEIWLC